MLAMLNAFNEGNQITMLCFQHLASSTGVHLWSITTMALATLFLVRKVLLRGIL